MCRGETASLGLTVKGGTLVVQRSPVSLPDCSVASPHPRFIKPCRPLWGKRPHSGSEVCSSVSIGEHLGGSYRNEDHLVLPRSPGPPGGGTDGFLCPIG